MYQGGVILPKSLYSIYTAHGAQCNTSIILYTILHGITNLDPNPRGRFRFPRAAPGEIELGRGQRPLGCATDPSDLPRHRGQPAAEGPTSTRRRWLHGCADRRPCREPCLHGSPLGLPCLRVIVAFGFACGSTVPSAQQASRTAAMHEREWVVAEEDHRVAGLLCR